MLLLPETLQTSPSAHSKQLLGTPLTPESSSAEYERARVAYITMTDSERDRGTSHFSRRASDAVTALMVWTAGCLTPGSGRLQGDNKGQQSRCILQDGLYLTAAASQKSAPYLKTIVSELHGA
ncbi:unnamed protein product [Pleuronectes platessa]|uniref:Uncharacterized protein n=1 Tax=Pleuronectes platessa TaxID=8262 RepID=A0A9N7VB25_PLEPL|nr:unnamed protein product [Pleuronectes platessa]